MCNFRTHTVAAILTLVGAVHAQVTQPPTRTTPPITTTPGGTVVPKTVPPVTTVPATTPPTTIPSVVSPRPGTAVTSTPAMTFPQPLFRIDDVSRALTINDRQLTQLNAISQRLQEQYQAQFDRLAGLPLQDRIDQQLQIDRAYAQAWLGGATRVLDARQLSRYQQLQLQYGGFSSFNDPGIQRQLNLTDAQLAQLNDALLWTNQQQQDIVRQAQADPERARQAYADFGRSYQDRLNRILNAEQQRTWSVLTGEAFPFPPPFGTPVTAGSVTPPK